MKNSSRIASIEMIRAICAVGIVWFHFAAHVAESPLYLLRSANESHGDLIVTLFFILSGYVMCLNYSGPLNLKEFFFRRFKALMPMYYLAFLVCFMMNVVETGRFFYNTAASPFSLLLTVFGLDGYFAYAVNDYYILGEWFQGAIVLLYAAYPMVLWGFNHRSRRTLILIIVLFLYVVYRNPFDIIPFRNFISCLMSFYTGMLLCKYKNVLQKKPVRLAATGLTIVGIFVSVPIDGTLFLHIHGPLAFLTLLWIGEGITRNRWVKAVCLYMGKMSYPLFLVHHVVIFRILQRFYPTSGVSYLLSSILSFAAALLCAHILFYCNRALLRSEEFLALESRLS